MDEITRAYIISSIKGIFDRWYWPPELFIGVFLVIPSCKLSEKDKFDPETGSPAVDLVNLTIGEQK